ncbi:MAG TPA: beta-propeller fold lactonase family protein, partial [Candidatus Sulfotelmatobacter sp.]|nr:beta-propeller fold lactonase family protein [Candidatus Sulfotelmatobacter sp.]
MSCLWRSFLAGAALLALAALSLPGNAAGPYLSPTALAATKDGQTLFIACATGKRVLRFDTASRQVTASIALPAPPSGLALSDDATRLFVTCTAPESQVCIIDIATGKIAATLPAGHTAMAPVLSPDGKTLFVCNRFNNDISVLDLASGKLRCRIPVQREPVAAAITPDSRFLLVANHLHRDRSDAAQVSAVVSVIDTAANRVVKELTLPDGSGLLNDLRISP